MNITLTREEAQQLLEVFELFLEEAEDVTTLENNLIKMLRTRLAQPEPDYEAEFIKDWNEGKVKRVSDGKRMVPEREWQGLTDEERLRCFDDIDWNKVDWCPDHEQYAKAIEAKLKEKNT
jgi:hypothetical protein